MEEMGSSNTQVDGGSQKQLAGFWQLTFTRLLSCSDQCMFIPRLDSLVWDASARCQICAQENPKQRALSQEGVQIRGQHITKQSNFTKI